MVPFNFPLQFLLYLPGRYIGCWLDEKKSLEWFVLLPTQVVEHDLLCLYVIWKMFTVFIFTALHQCPHSWGLVLLAEWNIGKNQQQADALKLSSCWDPWLKSSLFPESKRGGGFFHHFQNKVNNKKVCCLYTVPYCLKHTLSGVRFNETG